jgi:hypothetical protein
MTTEEMQTRMEWLEEECERLRSERDKARAELAWVAIFAEQKYWSVRGQIDEVDGNLTPWIHGDDWPCYPLIQIATRAKQGIGG